MDGPRDDRRATPGRDGGRRRREIPVVVRTGPTTQAWRSSELPDEVPTDVDEGELARGSTTRGRGPFRRRVEWTVDWTGDRRRVTERVSLDRRWYATLVAATAALLLGVTWRTVGATWPFVGGHWQAVGAVRPFGGSAVSGVGSTVPGVDPLLPGWAWLPAVAGPPLSALGFVGVLAAARELVAAGVLPDDALITETDPERAADALDVTYPGVGPAVALVATGAVAAVGPRVVGLVGGVLLAVVVGSMAIPGGYDRLSAAAGTLPERVPLVPTLYVVAAGGTAATLAVHVALVADVRFDAPAVVAAATVGALVVATAVLGAIGTPATAWLGAFYDEVHARLASRFHVPVAAAVTGLVPLGTVALTGVTVEVRPSAGLAPPAAPVPTPAFAPGIARLVVAAAVVAGTAVGVAALVDVGRVAHARLDRLGRLVDAPRAAVFASLSICAAGALLVVGAAFLATAGLAIVRTGSPLVLVTALAFGAPLWYFLAGAAYQFGSLVRAVRRYRSGTLRDPDALDPDLPIRTEHPVLVVDASDWTVEPSDDEQGVTDDADGDGPDDRPFLVAAYADPWREHVVASRGALDRLTAAELAVVLAHEESHFEHRGARLQFVFGLAPAFALLGKNVVFSLYDFAQREWTADRYAVRRFDEADGDADGAVSLRDALKKADDAPDLDAAAVGILPTAETAPDGESVRTEGLARVFAPFFGHFAGAVHPPTDERTRRLSIREWDDYGEPLGDRRIDGDDRADGDDGAGGSDEEGRDDGDDR